MKPWDDLHLLKLIDELEQTEPATLFTAYSLMERARPRPELDLQQDPRSFAHELLLARDAGLLTFVERHFGRPGRDPQLEAAPWLQEIGEIALTIAGRDRARGRLVITPLPDPDQDDGRMISGLTMEEIARAVGDTFTATQIPAFLVESGVPPSYLPAEVEGSKWEYVMAVLVALHDGGSASRRSLREFIGAWLSDLLHESPPDRARQRIESRLARQGWHVRNGVLVTGERTTTVASAPAPLDRDVRIASLHVRIKQVALPYLERGAPEVAIFEAFKAVNNRVKAMTDVDADGQDLMSKAMRDVGPPIRFGDLATESGRNVQAGLRFIFMGVVRAIRNPDAHEQFRSLTDEEAFEELGLASMLMRRLDASSQV